MREPPSAVTGRAHRVSFDNAAIDRAAHLALDSGRAFGGTAGRYGDNALLGHLVGKLGELATATWLRSQGVDPRELFLEPAARAAADLLVSRGSHQSPIRVEVKSWRSPHWDYAGSIAASQLRSVTGKADAVVWCLVEDLEEVAGLGSRARYINALTGDLPATLHVCVLGWNATEELAHIGTAQWHPGMHPDLTVAPAQWRDPDLFLTRSASWPPPGSRPGAASQGSSRLKEETCPRCAGPTLGPLCWECAPGQDEGTENGVLLAPDVFHRLGTSHRGRANAPEVTQDRPVVPVGKAALHGPGCYRCFPSIRRSSGRFDYGS